MNIEMYRIFFEIQKTHWWFTNKKKIVLDVINRHLDKTTQPQILDIGCGSGLMLDALQNIGNTCGMDMSDDAIRFSNEIFDGRVEKGALPDQIPYRDNCFDLIVALDVIEHVDEDVHSLKAIHSKLVPKGKAVITVPAYMFLWSPFDELNEHKRRYTLTDFNKKLVQAGFKVEKISYFNTILFPVVFVVRMLNKVLKRDGASDLDMPMIPLNYVLGKIFGIERFLLRFTNLPFGVSILAVASK